MPRGREREPGIKNLPGVPYRNDESGPNHYDSDTSRGSLCYVPREPIYRTMDFGGQPTGRGSIGAACRADYTQGNPDWRQSIKDTRVMPEFQLDGSYNTSAGQGNPRTSQQKRGINLGGTSEID